MTFKRRNNLREAVLAKKAVVSQVEEVKEEKVKEEKPKKVTKEK
jgi:hypothetical protein